MRLVYVAGRYTGKKAIDVQRNIQAARQTAVDLVREVSGVFPVVPHLLCQGWEDEKGYEWWLAATLELLRRCDAVIMVEGWQQSTGATAERDEALHLGIPVFTSESALAAWRAAAAPQRTETDGAGT